jgi:uncharacterized protein (TIGR02145 family)
MSGFSVLPDPNKFRLEPGEPVVEPAGLGYGLLYNWYAATDVRNIAAAGWHVPTYIEAQTFINYLGGYTVAGGELKEIGTTYWDMPNTAATNSVGFNMRGAGYRLATNGSFAALKSIGHIMESHDLGATHTFILFKHDNAEAQFAASINHKAGGSVRLIKDTTTLTHGEVGSYTDPSGYTYPTICIGTQAWVSCNVKTQHYRNGDPIPEVTNNAVWAALTSGALCAYDNDWNNV